MSVKLFARAVPRGSRRISYSRPRRLPTPDCALRNLPSRDWSASANLWWAPVHPSSRAYLLLSISPALFGLASSVHTARPVAPSPSTTMFRTLANASLRRSLHTSSRAASSSTRPARLRAVLGASAVATSYFVWSAWYGERIALDSSSSREYTQ